MLNLPKCFNTDNLTLLTNLIYLNLWIPKSRVLPKLSCTNLKLLDLSYYDYTMKQYKYTQFEDMSNLNICTNLDAVIMDEDSHIKCINTP